MAAADPRDARIATLLALAKAQASTIEQQAAKLKQQAATIDKQAAELEQQAAERERIEAQVRELTARLNTTSRNSHQPPSSDLPGTPGAEPDEADKPDEPDEPDPKPKRKRKKKRKRGGQPGHERSERELLPPEQVDEIVELLPDSCNKCGCCKLRKTDLAPVRSQVTEVPPPKPHVTEYRQHARECMACQAVTRAELPRQVVGSFGPRLTAMVAYMTGGLRLSKRVTQQFLADVLGVSMATGTVCKVEQRVRKALEPAVAEAREHVRDASVVHADETGWRENKQRAWLWVFCTPLICLFVIAHSRGRKVVKQALEGFAGILNSDRWNPYKLVEPERRQICWSHLIRDFRWMAERAEGPELEHVQVLQESAETMFRWWHKLRDGKMTRRGFRRCMTPLRERVEEALASLAEDGSAKVAGKADEIWKLRQALWTFVDREDVEPTNNFAERQIRHAVIWRKCSYGTDSAQGSRFVEAVLTVVLTGRQQGRNVLALLSDYVHAHFHGTVPPRLAGESYPLD